MGKSQDLYDKAVQDAIDLREKQEWELFHERKPKGKKPTLHDDPEAYKIAYKALANGAVMIGPNKLEWNLAKGCQSPYITERVYQQGTSLLKKTKIGRLTIVYNFRCRKCEPCLENKEAMWTARALQEMRLVQRTWFGTLTISPAKRYLFKLKAEANNGDWSLLSEEQRFKEVVDEINKELTLWLKRMRKDGRKFRYLVVYEKHKDGEPHIHMLLHEAIEGQINRRYLNPDPGDEEIQRVQPWPHGHVKWTLAKKDKAYYCTKYVSKEMATRVRASIRYGRS